MIDRPALWQLTPDRAEEWRAIRLEALRAAPEAYGSTLAEWVDRPLADFAARLAVVDTWAAGFRTGDPLAVAGWQPGGASGVADTGWITGVYVSPAARGRGLMDALLDRIAARAGHAGMARLGLYVVVDNAAARASYRRAGFGDIGAPVTNDRGLVQIEMQRALPVLPA